MSLVETNSNGSEVQRRWGNGNLTVVAGANDLNLFLDLHIAILVDSLCVHHVQA